MKNEELLKEAKRRYPKGTVYIPAHMPGSGEKCTAGNPDDFYIYNDHIIESHGNKEKNGHIYSEYIYDDGRWAEIVDSPKEIPLEEKYVDSPVDPNVFPAGSYVVLLASCDGANCWSDMPINHCYKLSQDSNNGKFYVDKDTNGSTTNGWWAYSDYQSKLKLRAATPEEIAEYQRLDKPFDVTKLEETFQIGKWYQCKDDPKLFIKPISIADEEVKVDVIWSSGTYGDSCSTKDQFKRWNLLEDLSIIQEFLPDGHPDKVVEVKRFFPQISLKVEQRIIEYAKSSNEKELGNYLMSNEVPSEFYTSFKGRNRYERAQQIKQVLGLEETKEEPKKSLVGRYLKALCDKPVCTDYKKGEYIKIQRDNGSGSVVCTRSTFFGYGKYAWEKSKVELMPEGFEPGDEVDVCTPNTSAKLKVGQWVKIIDKPMLGTPEHWNPDGEMDHYFGQWVQVLRLNPEKDHDFAIEEGWVLNHSDYTEVRDSKPETVRTWLDEQYKIQHQYNVLMNERESFIQSALCTQPLTPEESYKSCESKEDVISSHLILLDVKPVRVSKQFK